MPATLGEHGRDASTARMWSFGLETGTVAASASSSNALTTRER